METVVYRVADGVDISADIYPVEGQAPSPVALFFHGGALIMGDRTWIAPKLVSSFNDAGIAVVSADYRLAPETKLPAIATDIDAAHSWVRTEGADRFSFDPERVALVGGSAGGYLALLGVSTFQPKPTAVVSFYGYGDLTEAWFTEPDAFYNREAPISEERARSVVGSTTISRDPAGESHKRFDFYKRCRQQGTWPQEVCDHDPADADWYAPFEPLRSVSPDHPPTMLLHGEADSDVPFERSALMAEQFERHGVEHEFVTHPDWEHVFEMEQDDPSVDRAIETATDFLSRHLAAGPTRG